MKRKGIIAAGHVETARAGQSILEAGGNAFDAALGAMLTSFVAEPSLTSFGGGGFMTAYTANGQACLFDFFVQTPKHRRPVEEMDFVESHINFGTTTQKQFIGKGSVAVPGCPAGLFHIHQKLGYMPIQEIAWPAIELAKKGHVITPYQAYTVKILESILFYTEESVNIYAPQGHLTKAGEIVYRPDFAETLEWICEEGVRVFYEGEIGQKFAHDNAESGGSVSLEDLKSYQVIERDPIKLNYRDHILVTNPPPSEGGSMISFGMALVRELFPKEISLPPKGPEYVSMLASVMSGMDLFRYNHLPISEIRSGDILDYLNPGFVKPFKDKVDLLGNTTHISVLDAEGNAASVTTTLGGSSGCVIPGTGIPTNNMLGELDLNPRGFYKWDENVRQTSMMSPTIVVKDGRPEIVTGSGGSSRIRTAILQILLNLIDHKMPIHEAVAYPRVHWESHLLNLEPDLAGDNFNLPNSELKFWDEKHMFFGGAHTVVSEKGFLDGFADLRRDGSVKRVD